MNIRFYNAKILTMEEEKQYRIAEGELWVKGNTICYIGDGSDVARYAGETRSFSGTGRSTRREIC